MKRITCALLISCLVFVCYSAEGGLSRGEVLELFYDAGIAYKKGKYPEAIEKYESILEQKESGAIYFNLANTYFKNKQIGKAVLNYERALRLIPRDSDLRYNYKYVTDKIATFQHWSGQSFMARLINKMTKMSTFKEWGNFLTLSIILCLAAHLLCLYGRWTKKLKNPMLFIVLFLVVINVLFVTIKFAYEKNFSIVLKNVDTNFEPNESSTLHYRLSEGEKVKWIKSEYGWSKIMRRDGQLGWIPEEALELI